ncbi:MAG: hypothetical protein QOJ32_1803 [Frankiaceae bacterium]|jgi:hypothetical protein|nr:hypothetical protein [Frankiaceae bacterium]MDQ1634994.1 hypothetical protein [Frankiaceae bacterium]
MPASPDDGAARLALLREELRRLHAAVEYWSPSRWERPARGAVTAAGTGRSAEVMAELVRTLAVLARQAGSSAPVDAVPGSTGVHALADQLAVVAGELLDTPQPLDVVDAAQAAVAATRTALFG